jgi:NAD(P)-dependent dehydrogenase (short-subunit alcohol dehydrogenase family)
MANEINPLFNLTGKVALVTGGGAGLGREFCDVLAEFGADVVCIDQYKDRADETVEMIKKYGHKTMAAQVDVSVYDQVKAVFEQVINRFGKLDILVNNAGIAPPSALIDETELKDWQKVLDVNLSGVFYCLKEGLKIMRRQNNGNVINISSGSGISGSLPDILSQSPYVAAKHGVVGLTKEAAGEYGQFNVRVNCICPGFHEGTRLPESHGIKKGTTGENSRKDLIKSWTPLRRTATPKELRGLLIYLASDACSYTTGAIIPSDGGWTAAK